MKTYKIDYLWNGTSQHVSGVLTDIMLDEVRSNPKNKILSLEDYTPFIGYKAAEGCERCTWDEFVPHYNCHCRSNRAHCTSDYCY